MGPTLIEYEYNHVFIGIADDPDIQPHSGEVINWDWVSPHELRTDVAASPYRYTAWFRLLLDEALATSPT